MCGIAGIFSYKAGKVDLDEVMSMREAMARRGPDGAGLWVSEDNSVAMAHRRLAIIDLSNSASQPMEYAGGRFRIVFNGEIYNYRELRCRLEQRGHKFVTNSDTEVLLALYVEYGEGMFAELRGMYAFAIWDAARGGVFLARDPLGIKPLYYSLDGDVLRFASQVKALLAGRKGGNTHDPAGYVGFFLWGFVPEPYTLYKEIRCLPAGTYVWIDGHGTPVEKSFFSLAVLISSSLASPHKSMCSDAELRGYFEDTVSVIWLRMCL